MDSLKKYITAEGRVLSDDILKVDSFLNHQIDTVFLTEVGKEFRRRYNNCEVNKILTVEASGIAIGCVTSQFFDNCPVVFAKKGQAKNMSGDAYHATLHSYTRGADFVISVTKKYLTSEDKVLIVDDFLAKGNALNGLIDIVRQADAKLAGCAIAIEKGFQGGGVQFVEAAVAVDKFAAAVRALLADFLRLDLFHLFIGFIKQRNELIPEPVKRNDFILVAACDLIQFGLHLSRILDVHDGLREEFRQLIHSQFSLIGRNEHTVSRPRILQFHIAAVLDRIDDHRIGARPSDALFLKSTDQFCLGIACRRYGLVPFRFDPKC